LLIKQIIKSRLKRILINRPRRWGKSTNMSMIYSFFNLEINQQKKQFNLTLFQGGNAITKNGVTKNF
jgi:hypothetical protein